VVTWLEVKHDPTNSGIALKDNGWSGANPTRLSSLKCKEKDVTKKNYCVYSTMKIKDKEALERQDLNQARSKPDTAMYEQHITRYNSSL